MTSAAMRRHSTSLPPAPAVSSDPAARAAVTPVAIVLRVLVRWSLGAALLSGCTASEVERRGTVSEKTGLPTDWLDQPVARPYQGIKSANKSQREAVVATPAEGKQLRR